MEEKKYKKPYNKDFKKSYNKGSKPYNKEGKFYDKKNKPYHKKPYVKKEEKFDIDKWFAKNPTPTEPNRSKKNTRN